jgi:hypothetical protein
VNDMKRMMCSMAVSEVVSIYLDRLMILTLKYSQRDELALTEILLIKRADPAWPSDLPSNLASDANFRT